MLREDPGSDLGDDVRDAYKALAGEEPASDDAKAADAETKAPDDETTKDKPDTATAAPADEASAGDETEDGKDDDTGETAAAPEDDTGGEDDESDQTKTQEPAPIEPPSRFSDEQKATFTALPREAQEFVLARHQEMEGDYTRKTQELAGHRQTADAFNAAAEPYAPYMASLGTNALDAFKVLMAAEHRLRNGSADEKKTIMAQLAKDYGVDLSAVDQAPSDDEFTDPAFAKVQAGIDRITLRLDQGDRHDAAAQTETAQTEINAFAGAVDASGNPAHPHFETVRATMGNLMAGNETLSIQDAYDNAVWAAPELRQSLLAAQSQEAAAEAERNSAATKAKADKERAGKAKKARKAAAGVQAGAEPAGGSKPPGTEDLSIHEQVAKDFAELSSSP